MANGTTASGGASYSPSNPPPTGPLPGTGPRSQVVGVALVALAILVVLALLGWAYSTFGGKGATSLTINSTTPPITVKKDVSQTLEPVQHKTEVPEWSSNNTPPASPPIQPVNPPAVPAGATVTTVPAGGTLQQTINVYCGGGKPCSEPAKTPKAIIYKKRPKANKITAKKQPTPAMAVTPPCPDGNCSKYAWNPADARQPRPGEVSQRVR
jgi:hypothetical protein